MNLVLHKQVDYSTCEAFEAHKKSTRQHISLGHMRKRAISPNALGSDGSRNKSFNKEHDYGASISSEVVLEKGKPFFFFWFCHTETFSNRITSFQLKKLKEGRYLKKNFGQVKILLLELTRVVK